MDYNEAISNLKFISRIKSGEKINVKFMYVQQDCILTKLSRTLQFENRHHTFNFIRSTINRSFEIASAYSSSKLESELRTALNVISDLKLSKHGIQNLKETYSNDIKFSCDMDTILQEIDAKLIDISTETIDNPTNPNKKWIINL